MSKQRTDQQIETLAAKKLAVRASLNRVVTRGIRGKGRGARKAAVLAAATMPNSLPPLLYAARLASIQRASIPYAEVKN